MTAEEELAFLASVRAYTESDPSNLEKLIRVATEGIVARGAAIRAHAVDMEAIASMALNTRLFKGNDKFIADKLESWKHMNGLCWDDQIKKLRSKS